jgi:hypothetical protein
VFHGVDAEIIRSVLQKDYKYFITVVRRINQPGSCFGPAQAHPADWRIFPSLTSTSRNKDSWNQRTTIHTKLFTGFYKHDYIKSYGILPAKEEGKSDVFQTPLDNPLPVDVPGGYLCFANLAGSRLPGNPCVLGQA